MSDNKKKRFPSPLSRISLLSGSSWILCASTGALLVAGAYGGLIFWQSKALDEAAAKPATLGAIGSKSDERSTFRFDIEPLPSSSSLSTSLWSTDRPIHASLHYGKTLLGEWDGIARLGLQPALYLKTPPHAGGLLQNPAGVLDPTGSFSDASGSEKGLRGLSHSVSAIDDWLVIRFSLTGDFIGATYEMLEQIVESANAKTGMRGSCRFGDVYAELMPNDNGTSWTWTGSMEASNCRFDVGENDDLRKFAKQGTIEFKIGRQTAEIVLDTDDSAVFSIRSESDGWSNPFITAGRSSFEYRSYRPRALHDAFSDNRTGTSLNTLAQRLEVHVADVSFKGLENLGAGGLMTAVPMHDKENAFFRPLSADSVFEVVANDEKGLPRLEDFAAALTDDPIASQSAVQATADRIAAALQANGAKVDVKDVRVRYGDDYAALRGKVDVPAKNTGHGGPDLLAIPEVSFHLEATEALICGIASMIGLPSCRSEDLDRFFRRGKPAPVLDGAAQPVSPDQEVLKTKIYAGESGLLVNGKKVF